MKEHKLLFLFKIIMFFSFLSPNNIFGQCNIPVHGPIDCDSFYAQPQCADEMFDIPSCISVDTIAPIISCPLDIITANDSGACGSNVSYTAPDVIDNCPDPIINQISGLASGAFFPVGTTINTYIAIDSSGNTDSCSFSVIVEDTEPPVINCPQGFTVPNLQNNCHQFISWPTVTATDNCTPFVINQTAGPAPDSSGFASLDVGETLVSFMARDTFGNKSYCSFTISVLDTLFPVINCPSDTIVSSPDVVTCAAPVSWSAPTVTDNCTYNITVSHTNGTYFPIGDTRIHYSVTDPSGNMDTCSFRISVHSMPLLLTTTSTNVSCFGYAEGSIELSVDGGCIPYSYNWSNGATTDGLSNLTAGTYTVTVTDEFGKTATTSVTITEPAQLEIGTKVIKKYNGEAIKCHGGSDAKFGVRIRGGTSPYNLLWSNGSSSAIQLNQAAGIYFVTITDANNCVIEDTVLVDEPDPIIATAIIIDDSCSNALGAIDLSAMGGTPPFDYFWSNSSVTQDITGLNAGNFTVEINDANDCELMQSYTVNDTCTTIPMPPPTQSTAKSKDESTEMTINTYDKGQFDVKTYPVPFDQKLNVEISGVVIDENLRVAVVNAIGQVVWHGQVVATDNPHTLEISLNNLATGNYYIRVEAGEKRKTVRIQKQ